MCGAWLLEPAGLKRGEESEARDHGKDSEERQEGR